MGSYTSRLFVNWKESLVWDNPLKRRQLQAISLRQQKTVNLGEVLVIFITFLI